MQRTRALARAAARRRLASRLVRSVGVALAWGGAAALLGAIADRLVGPGVSPWTILGATLGPALIIGTILALRGRGSPLDAAVEVDTRLGLKDRLASALSLAERAPDDPFAQMAGAEAEDLASRVNVSRAIPVRWGQPWAIWPVLAGVAAAVGLILEPLHLWRAKRADTEPTFSVQEAMAAQEDLKRAKELSDRAAMESGAAGTASGHAEKTPDVLERLEKELMEGSRAPDDARSAAAGALEDRASEIESASEQELARHEALRNLLDELPPADRPDQASAPPAGAPSGAPGESNPADPLADALRKADPEAAAAAAEQLRRQMGLMSESERRRAAEALDHVSRDLRDAADKRDADDQKRRAAEESPLLDQGLTPEQAEQVRDQSHPAEIEKTLKEMGVPEDRAQRIAEQQARKNAERQAREAAANEARRIADSARDAAKELREGPREPSTPRPPSPPNTTKQPDAAQPRGSKEAGEQKPGESKQNPEAKKPNDQSRHPDQREATGEQKPGESSDTTSKPEGESKRTPGEQSKEPRESQPRQGESQDKREGAQQDKQPSGADQPKPTEGQRKGEPSRQDQHPGQPNETKPTTDAQKPDQQTPKQPDAAKQPAQQQPQTSPSQSPNAQQPGQPQQPQPLQQPQQEPQPSDQKQSQSQQQQRDGQPPSNGEEKPREGADPSQQQRQQDQQPQQPGQQKQQPSQQQRDGQPQPQDQEGQPSQEPQAQPSPSPSDRRAEKQTGDQPRPSGDQQEQKPVEQQPGGEQKPEPQRGARQQGENQDQRQPGEQQEPGAQQNPDSQDGASNEGAQPQPGTKPDQAPKPGENAKPSEQGGEPSAIPTDTESLDRLRKQLEELAKRPQDAEKMRRRAEEMREQARKMLDRLSPEERKRLEQWAMNQKNEESGPDADDRQDQQDQPSDQDQPSNQPPGRTPRNEQEQLGGDQPRGDQAGSNKSPTDKRAEHPEDIPADRDIPMPEKGGSGAGSAPSRNNPANARTGDAFRTEDVDARKSGGGADKVVSEWTPKNQPNARPGGRPAVDTRPMSDQLQDAAKGADRAIEEQLIPSRYRNVRDYFAKARQRAEEAERAAKAAETPKAPAPAAKDAGPAPTPPTAPAPTQNPPPKP